MTAKKEEKMFELLKEYLTEEIGDYFTDEEMYHAFERFVEDVRTGE